MTPVGDPWWGRVLRRWFTTRALWELRMEVEPRDVWVGLFWTRLSGPPGVAFYLCILPCVVFRLRRTNLPPHVARHLRARQGAEP